MKKMNLILVNALVIVLLVLSACSSSPTRPSVEVSHDEFLEVQGTISRLVSKEIEVATGSSFTVTLWSNQTTGFSWSELTFHGNGNIVEVINHEYVTPSQNNSESQMVGTSGSEVWTFRALKEGSIDISTEYGQPWEGGEKGAFSFFLTVVVN